MEEEEEKKIILSFLILFVCSAGWDVRASKTLWKSALCDVISGAETVLIHFP